MNGVAARERQLDHGVAAAPDHEGVAVVDLGTAVALGRSRLREPAATSRRASARAVVAIASASPSTARHSSSNSSSSKVSARSAALAIRLSSSASSCVLYRVALAML